MFTGIVTAVGTVRDAQTRGDLRLEVTAPLDPASLAIGASVSCSGVCLTVVERGPSDEGAWFAVDVSGETVSRTAAGHWEPGARLNLEPALRLGDELGGHIVTGHVDGVGTVAERAGDGDSIRLTIAGPAALAPFIAEKGSVTVDGVSLTVNSVTDRPDGETLFGLNIIPHTGAVTTLGTLQPGDAVNLEIDVLARYLQRMQQLRG